jgi:tetratricopeptide (TPR) repeat protein
MTVARALLGIVAGCVLMGACGSRDSAPPASSPPRDGSSLRDGELPAVTMPDVSQLAESVQRQLREGFEALAGKRAGGTASRSELADAHGDFGRLLLAARLGRAAAICFEHAERLTPRDRRWPYYLGHAFLLLADRPQALLAFERAIALAPTDLATLVWLAETQLDDGRPADAERTFRTAASLHPRSAAARFGAGRAALARQAHAEAVALLEEALAIDSRASAIRYPLAMAYRALGDRVKAEAHLKQRGESWPALPDPLMDQQADLLESVTIYERRGVDALAAGDWSAAAAAFRKGLELEPDDPALGDRLGNALYAAGDVEAAVETLEAVVRRSPHFTKANVSLGTIFTLRGRYADAIQRFSAALTSDPSSVEVRLGLAEALRVSGQPDASLPHYQRAIQLDPAIPGGWVGGAMALISLRRYPQAREWLADGRRVHPDEPKLAELATLLPSP